MGEEGRHVGGVGAGLGVDGGCTEGCTGWGSGVLQRWEPRLGVVGVVVLMRREKLDEVLGGVM